MRMGSPGGGICENGGCEVRNRSSRVTGASILGLNKWEGDKLCDGGNVDGMRCRREEMYINHSAWSSRFQEYVPEKKLKF